MALTQVPASMQESNAQYTGFKNRIINGAMVIDQRNAGALVSGANGFITDRWTMAKYSSGSGVYSGQQVTDAPAGFTNSLKVTITTNETSQPTDAYWQVFQRGEGYNFADLGFGTSTPSAITVSFWVKSSVAGTYSASIFNDGFGGTNRNYVTTYTINSANTWEYKSFTVAGDGAAGSGFWSKTNGTSVCLFFDMGSGVNQTTSSPNTWTTENTRRASGSIRLMATNGATWQVTGVQLEKGSTATSFDYRPYGTELALCQRYYEDSKLDTNGQTILMKSGLYESNNYPFKVIKRASPTMTSLEQTWWPFGGGTGTTSTYTLVSSPNSFYIATPNGSSWTFAQKWAASAEL